MNDEFENALAWFTSAPANWIESGEKNLEAAAQWVWEVLQGDFNENASTSQIATGTIISMIPFVDQLCDVRDLVANCKKINDEPDTSWHWISLVLTLVGLFPSIGSLVKGSLKVMFAGVRKGGAISGISPHLDIYVDASVAQLNRFLARPEVAKVLVVLKWDNPYATLAKEIRKVAVRISVTALHSALDEVSNAAKSMLKMIQNWGGQDISKKAVELSEIIDSVRKGADRQLADALKPVQVYINGLARRLEIDADRAHRAHLNTVNPHAFKKISSPVEEIETFKKSKPAWVDKTGILAYPPLNAPPSPRQGYPSVRDFHTFHAMKAGKVEPGVTLYRIVDPTSKDNSICWMREEEFKTLKSKAEWRRKFGVWAHWNANGEYVTYTVPPGQGLLVWEGKTASQRLDDTSYIVEGGANQIVISPSDMNPAYVGKRKKTGWGYDDLGKENNMVGVPELKNNFVKEK